MERAGQRVAAAALNAADNAQELPAGLSAKVVHLQLPVLPPAEPEAAKATLRAWQTAHSTAMATGDRGLITHRAGMVTWAEAELARSLGESPEQPHTFTIQHLQIGQVHLLAFAAEMFVNYQLDLETQAQEPVICAAYGNGCINYLPAAADYADGGYEVSEAWKYYQAPMFSPQCESLVRQAAYTLLGIKDPDQTPYPASAAPR